MRKNVTENLPNLTPLSQHVNVDRSSDGMKTDQVQNYVEVFIKSEGLSRLSKKNIKL